MLSQSEQKWNALQNGEYETVLDPAIANLWRNCKKAGIDPSSPGFLKDTNLDFDDAKATQSALLLRANRILKSLIPHICDEYMGLALFSEDGYLLKLYGNGSFLEWSASLNIVVGTKWCGDRVPPHGVSAGMLLQKPVQLSGWENYSRDLLPVSISFSPIFVNQGAEEQHRMNIVGGIAIMAPEQKTHNSWLFSAISIAREVTMSYWQFNSSTALIHAFLDAGVVTIDNTQEEKRILVYNSSFCKTMKIKQQNLYKKRLDSIIDPAPKNKEFWEMLDTQNKNELIDLYLSLKDNNYRYQVSVIPYRQDVFGISGCRLFFFAKEDVTKFISKEIGDNAYISFADVIGKCPHFLRIVSRAKQIAKTDSNLLITGESGVGKDVFAQAIHNEGKRNNRPFIAINCAALPRELIASELFGYETGAFTGARRGGNIGKFELANGGTLFLDEIGDMPIELQATLLRVIEQKSFMKIGSSIQTHVDVKIVAATNIDLMEKIRQKLFRQDLFYRLSETIIHLPSLRERKEDIELLARNFIRLHCERNGVSTPKLTQDALEVLVNLPWKGNIRELQNFILGMMHTFSAANITREHVLAHIEDTNMTEVQAEIPPLDKSVNTPLTSECPLIKSTIPYSKQLIEFTLMEYKYDRQKAAKALGISRSTLYRRMKDYNLI